MPAAAAAPAAPAATERPAPAGLRAIAVPALFLLAYLLVWFVPPPKLEDRWNEALTLVNAARAASDAAEKKALLDSAGGRFAELLRDHPYHARVQFYAAYYYNDAGDYDASIAHAKEAIRLGSGARVNQVDGIAGDVLADAALRKARPLLERNDYAGARAVIDDAWGAAPANKRLGAARDALAGASAAPR